MRKTNRFESLKGKPSRVNIKQRRKNTKNFFDSSLTEQARFNLTCLESYINEKILTAGQVQRLNLCECLNLYGLKSYITEGKLSVDQVIGLSEQERLDIYSSGDISKFYNNGLGM